MPVTVKAIAEYHIKPRPRAPTGWPGIGYGAVLVRDGTLYLTQPFVLMSYHVAGRNEDSFGVGVEGDFRDGRKPTLAQQEVLPLVGPYILTLLNETRVTPGRRITQVAHGEHALIGFLTSCPGELMNYV